MALRHRLRLLLKTACIAIVASVGLAVAPGFAPNAVAASKVEPLPWLRKQPLTLFDWGVWRLERDVSRVGRWLEDAEALSEPPKTGVEWQWRRKKISMFVSIAQRPALRTGAYCQRIYGVVRRKMMGSEGPTGPGRASWYLRSVFFPQGREWSRPTKDFAERLVKFIHLQVVLLGHPSEGLRLKAPKIVCSGTLDTERPLVRKQIIN